EESNRRISVPEAQPFEFVLAFHVGHAQLQYGRGPIRKRHRRYPRATQVVERRTKSQRPAALQVPQRVGQPVEPRPTLGRLTAVSHQPLRSRRPPSQSSQYSKFNARRVYRRCEGIIGRRGEIDILLSEYSQYSKFRLAPSTLQLSVDD